MYPGISDILNDLMSDKEFKNKFDADACAIYFRKLKIGYVPKSINSLFIKMASKKKYFIFISCFNPYLVDFYEPNEFSYPIIAIPSN